MSMINVEELNDIISQMSEYKSIKAIKVTTRFFDYLELMTKLSPYYSAPPIKPRSGDPATLKGVPVIIDDDIDGFFKVEF